MIGLPTIHESDWAPTTYPIAQAASRASKDDATPANPAESRHATPTPVMTCAA